MICEFKISPSELYALLVCFQLATRKERSLVWDILFKYREVAHV